MPLNYAKKFALLEFIDFTLAEVYSEPFQTFKRKTFEKVVNSFSRRQLFSKLFILDVWQCLNTPVLENVKELN